MPLPPICVPPLRARSKAVAALAILPLLAACATEVQRPAPALTAGPVVVAATGGEIGSDVLSVAASPYGDYLAGLVAGNQNDLSAAADFMLLVYETDPNNFDLLRRTFTLVSADGRHTEAVRLAEKIVEQDPELSTANIVLAVDAVDRGDNRAAAEILDSLPKKGLNNMIVPLLASWVALGDRAVEEALTAIEPLSDTTGLAALNHMHVALLNDLSGRTAEAEAAYRAAIEAASQPSLRLTWLAGNFFEREGKSEEARKLYDAYLAQNNGSILFEAAFERLQANRTPGPAIDGHKGGLAEALFNLASLLSQERAELMALIHVHLALRLDPDFEVANLLLGEILQSQDRGEDAIAVYRRIDPASALAWSARLRIADELDRMERSEEAIAELDALAAERPKHFEPLFRMGNILRTQERFPEAVVAYDRAFERLTDAEADNWTLYYFRGIALERARDWPRAEADFLKALELMPEQPYVMNYLAYSWVEQKQHLDRAEEMLVRAVELRPTDGFIVDSLGWVYYRLGQFDKAVTHLEKAVELRPQDPVINDHLGDAYWRVGRHQEARFQWRRALSLEPEADLVPTIEGKIENGLQTEPENI